MEEPVLMGGSRFASPRQPFTKTPRKYNALTQTRSLQGPPRQNTSCTRSDLVVNKIQKLADLIHEVDLDFRGVYDGAEQCKKQLMGARRCLNYTKHEKTSEVNFPNADDPAVAA